MAFSSAGNENQSAKPKVETASAEIDQEVAQAMAGASIEDLMAAASKGGPTLDPNRPVRGGRPTAAEGEQGTPGREVKRGRVVSIRDRSVFVDVGGKSQGVVPLEQFADVTESEDAPGLRIGDEFDFVFKGYDREDGLLLLARQGSVTQGGWESLREGDVVEATVTGHNKGGLEVKVNNLRGFMPAGQVDTRFNADLSTFVGQRFKCVVTKVDRMDRNLIVSRKEILQQEEAVKKEQTWKELSVGQIREGTVRSVVPFGAFVDLGGVDGLLHVSAMSHTRVSDPSKVVKPGDKIQVMVLNIDKEKQKVSLGLKQMGKDPWEKVQEEFAVGTVQTGLVKKLMEFGAFVELSPGVEGLVHISQLSTKRVVKVSDVVKEGDTVKVKILQIDGEKKRISLSMSEVERDERAAAAAAAAPAAAPAAATPAAPTAAAAPVAPAKAPAKPAAKKYLKGGL